MSKILKSHMITCLSRGSKTLRYMYKPFQNHMDSAYSKAIRDLNELQSNTVAVSLAKYNNAKEILPLFKKQLELSGIEIIDLNKLNIIHVAGTKGKGSTCAFIENILRRYNLKTGFYNSPHLVKVTERIRINGTSLDELRFTRYFREIHDRLQLRCREEKVSLPTYFSFLTILAFHTFLKEEVDCAIVEVGIGGEYDPTNITSNPVVCGITTLDFDHTTILGKTIESIAHTKAGIAKQGTPIFTVTQNYRQTIDIIKKRAAQTNSPVTVCKPLLVPSRTDFKLGIDGKAQYLNASLACHLANYWLSSKRPEILKDDIEKHRLLRYKTGETSVSGLPFKFKESLQQCQWSGRCQIIQIKPRLTFFLDGAHTRSSMENCRDWYLSASKEIDPLASRVLAFNIIGTRDKRDVMLPLIETHGDNFDLTIFSTNKISAEKETKTSDTFVNFMTNPEKSLENAQNNARIWEELLKYHNKETQSHKIIVKSTTSEMIDYLLSLLKKDSVKNLHVLVTGSLHFVGAVMDILRLN